MRWSAIVIIVVIVLVLVGGWWFFAALPRDLPKSPIAANNMKLESSAFQHNGAMPPLYTCDGRDINPPLRISGVPEDAKSLVLIMDDPDAPSDTWVHWVVWSINPKTTEIAEDSVPVEAKLGATSFGRPGYGGPCPPSGAHRYFFKLYALDIPLTLSSGATTADVETAMAGHILAQTELVGLYSKK